MIRSIDMQQAIIQIGQAEKVQQVQQQHSDMQQRHFELQLKEEKRQLHAKVNNANETKEAEVGEREERERRRGMSHRDENNDSEFNNEESDEPLQGKIVNIKV